MRGVLLFFFKKSSFIMCLIKLENEGNLKCVRIEDDYR